MTEAIWSCQDNDEITWLSLELIYSTEVSLFALVKEIIIYSSFGFRL